MAYPRRSSSRQARSSPIFPRVIRARVMTRTRVQDERHVERKAPAFARQRRYELRPGRRKDRKESIGSAGLAAFAFNVTQSLVENPDRRVGLLAREHERRREPDRVFSRAEHQQ